MPQFRTSNYYLKKEDLERILSQSVYSSRDTHNALSDASKIIDQLLSKLRRNEPDDSEELLERVRAFKSETETFETKWRKVEYELPFSKWLYDYVSAKLPKCYIVTTQRENFIHEDCLPHNVSPCQTNEYASLKADLVIYKDKLRNGDEINCVVTEIKIADDSAYTVSDCFRNMSGVAASLATRVLRERVFVKQVNVIGLVLQVSDTSRTMLLKLVWDFGTNTCKFMKSQQVFEFDYLINAAVSVL